MADKDVTSQTRHTGSKSLARHTNCRRVVASIRALRPSLVTLLSRATRLGTRWPSPKSLVALGMRAAICLLPFHGIIATIISFYTLVTQQSQTCISAFAYHYIPTLYKFTALYLGSNKYTTILAHPSVSLSQTTAIQAVYKLVYRIVHVYCFAQWLYLPRDTRFSRY